MAKTPTSLPPPKPPNPAAKALADARHRPQVVTPKKGKGSYRRKKPAGPEAEPTSE